MNLFKVLNLLKVGIKAGVCQPRVDFPRDISTSKMSFLCANAILGKEDHVKMVKYLIDNGSEVNVVTNAGNTALIFASR